MPPPPGTDNASNRPRLPGPHAQDRPEAFGRGEHVDPEKQKKEQDGDQEKQGGDQGDRGDQNKGEKKQDPRPFYKRPVLMISLSSLFLAAIIFGLYLWIHGRNYESTDDAFIDGRIVRISPRVSGKVISMPIDDNRPVTAEQILIQIDPAPFQAKVDQAVAAVAEAEAQLAQAKANEAVAEATADQSDADVLVAEANAKNAKQNIDRYNNLPPAARTQQQVDQANADYRSTDANVTAAKKKADASHAQVEAAKTMIHSQEAAVNSAKAQLEQANLDLGYTSVRAGHAGRITRRTVEVGNYISAGQEILDVVPTDAPADLWVTANFKETQLEHIKPGQRVTISVDAFPDEKLTGHVDSIQNGTGAVFSLLPPENATGNYVKVVQRVPVKIVIDGHPDHLLSPGMSVEPEVDISARPDPTIGDEPTQPFMTQPPTTQPPAPQPPAPQPPATQSPTPQPAPSQPGINQP
jgi:membrane fusion protein (multidrug efflux system)